jgi:hypothetical protein
MKYAGNIKRIVPTLNQVNVQNKTYYKGLIAVQRVLTTNLGLSEQQAEEYTYFAAQQGKNAALTLKATEAVASALDPEGDMGYFKIITEGVAKAGASAQLSFGKMPGNLEVAVLKANRLGLEIADLKSMSDSLLNIESSIGQELEYQLLSGHRLVGNEKSRADFQGKSLTNLYRSATLQRDASKQASILNTILEQEGETLENNVIARQQMSQLLGIDEEKLSRALQKKKLLEASGAEILMELEGSELEAAARGMMDTGQLTEEAFQDLMKLSDNRTTEDIMKEQLQAQQDLALNSYLTNDQLRLIAELNGATQKDAQKYNEKLLQYSEEREKELGKVLIAYRKPLEATVINTARDSEYGVPKDVIEEQDALIMNDGFIRFNPLDKFMQVADGAMIAGTNVDGNKKFANALNGAGAKMTDNQVSQLIQAFAAVGSLIENAINSQTTALKRDGLFAPGINGSTY